MAKSMKRTSIHPLAGLLLAPLLALGLQSCQTQESGGQLYILQIDGIGG